MEFLNGVNKIIDSKYGRFEFWVVFFVSLPNRFCRPEDWLYSNREKAKQQTAQVSFVVGKS